MKKLDKKQIPQMILLAVLACAMFGYFAYRMITPTPAAAHSPAASGATTVVTAPAAGATTADPAATADPASLQAKVSPPGPGLRDPFVQAISGQAAPAPAPAAPVPGPGVGSVKPVKVASLPPAVPFAPPLPQPWVRETPSSALPGGHATVVPQPVVIPPPAWTVTGVLASGSEHVAILRNGADRRFVKKGEYIDDLFIVAAVKADSVVLRHGSSRFILPLGGAAHAAQAVRLSSPTASRRSAPKSRPAPTTVDVTRAEPAPLHVAQARPVPSPRLLRRLAVKSIVQPVVRHAFAAPCLRPAASVTTVLPAAAPASGLLPIGSLAPDFSLQTLGGDTQSLSQHRGQVVLLHFWSSWCHSCQAGLPLLKQLGDEYGPKGLSVLSVNSWDNAASLQSFVTRQGLNGSSVLYDPSVANESVAVRLYKAPDVPALYVIDQNGGVAATFVGYSPQVFAGIKRVLASLGVS